MEQSQESEKFERFLRSSKVVAGGFLGEDERALREIIDSDLLMVQKAGVTIEQLAGRMKELSEAAKVLLGNPVEVTIQEIAERIITYTEGRSRIVYRPLPEDDPKRRRPDISRAQNLLNWGPTVDIDDGFKRTMEYFQTVLKTM